MTHPFIEHVNLTVSDPDRTAGILSAIFGWHERWRGPAINDGWTIHVGNERDYLAIYATGFSLPMLAVAYLSHGLRRYLNTIMRHPAALRWISGSLLIAFGTVVTSHGMLAFSF